MGVLIALLPCLLLCIPSSASDESTCSSSGGAHTTKQNSLVQVKRAMAKVVDSSEANRSSEEKYVPSIHASQVSSAFNAVLAETGPLHTLILGYRQSGVRKWTEGTCWVSDCYPWRGATDCINHQCVCQDGHSTADRKTCQSPMVPVPVFATDTGGTCRFWGCDSSRGPTSCINSRCICQARYATIGDGKCRPISEITGEIDFATDTGGTCRFWGCDSSRGPTSCTNRRCICQAGYATIGDGKCRPISEIAGEIAEAALAEAAWQVRFMMSVGAREPDELACPGGWLERGTMGYANLKLALGYSHFNVSLCRTAVQAYHGSPPPLVPREDLRHQPLDNGYEGVDNAIPNLYAVVSNRQWRTHLLRIMAVEFVYALAMPDLSEGAKRLGNLFHTLSDTYCTSHVQRRASENGVVRNVRDILTRSSSETASSSACSRLAVIRPLGMDTTNFGAHVPLDFYTRDLEFKCSQFFQEKAIRLWAQARVEGVSTAEAANRHVDLLLSEVLCPALEIAAEDLDKPAGGTPPLFSAAIGRPSYPRGLADERDADRIIGGWAAGLAAQRAAASASKQRRIPQGFSVPTRLADACATPSVAHVAEGHVQLAREGALPPQYLQPYL